MARPYPMHVSLEGARVLVVGAGRVAQRRIARLLEAGAVLHVVAPIATGAIGAWAEGGELKWSQRAFRSSDCKGMRLVLIATDDTGVNARAENAARAVRAWVNRADAPERCDFWVPAAAHSEACVVSLGTRGRAPSASRRLARELAAWLAAGPDRFVSVVEGAREALAEMNVRQAPARLRELADGPLLEACRAGDDAKVQRLLDAALEPGGKRG